MGSDHLTAALQEIVDHGKLGVRVRSGELATRPEQSPENLDFFACGLIGRLDDDAPAIGGVLPLFSG